MFTYGEHCMFMNMEEREIIETALENINLVLKVSGHWAEFPNKELDAYVTLNFQDGPITFETEIKIELREHFIQKLIYLGDKYPNFLLLAYRIYPKYKKLLQELGINYLEANGNAFIKKHGIFILIDNHPSLKELEGETNRAYTKTGLRVFFQLLLANTNLFATQRELAEQAGVALGNVPQVIKGLKKADLLLKKNEFGYQWKNKEEAISQWISGYRTALKPALFLGKFRLPNDKPWTEIPLITPRTKWGGEPGGDILTNYLRPEKFILFTDLKRIDFIKAARLTPDSNGEIELYETFWKKGDKEEKSAPPLLVYADLIINEDKRSLDTAQIIYERYLQEL